VGSNNDGNKLAKNAFTRIYICTCKHIHIYMHASIYIPTYMQASFVRKEREPDFKGQSKVKESRDFLGGRSEKLGFVLVGLVLRHDIGEHFFSTSPLNNLPTCTAFNFENGGCSTITRCFVFLYVPRRKFTHYCQFL
jgi:hypothetical protein